MYVIITYDVGVKRNSKVLKICRRYLLHVQKSVFEGHITETDLKKLMKEIEHVIIPEEDQVAIYEFDTIRYTNKWMIGYHKSSDNII